MKRARSTRPRQEVRKGDTPSTAAPSRDAIAARAYELYLERGGADGKDIDDWLRAEQDLRARQSRLTQMNHRARSQRMHLRTLDPGAEGLPDHGVNSQDLFVTVAIGSPLLVFGQDIVEPADPPIVWRRR